jgi:hypothetical protein
MLNDSTIIMGGYTWNYHSPYSKMWLFSINTDGDTLWTYEEDEGWNYSARSIDITHDEHIIMLMSDWHLGKYTYDRVREWKYKFPTDWYINQTEKIITVHGHEPPGYALAGFTSSGSTSDIYFIRYNEYDHEHNDTSWIRYYNASERDVAWDIIEITNPSPGLPKGFLLVGSNKNAVCCTSLCYAVRIDTTGDTVWTKEYSHPLYKWTGLSHGKQEIKTVTWAGNEPYQTKFMLGAYTAYPESLGGKYVTWLLAISDTTRGDTLWTKTFDEYYEQFSGDIISCDDGGYAIVGSVKETSISGSNLWFLRVDSLGNDLPSAISENSLGPVLPTLYSHPNPFNSAVTIAIEGVGDGSPVPFDVEIYDVNGRKIDVIARRAEPNEAISPNNRSSVPLDTRRDAVSINNCEFVWQPDKSLPSGVYLVRARVGGRGDLAPTGQTTATKRIVYLK